jgi:hypothetical protein
MHSGYLGGRERRSTVCVTPAHALSPHKQYISAHLQPLTADISAGRHAKLEEVYVGMCDKLEEASSKQPQRYVSSTHRQQRGASLRDYMRLQAAPMPIPLKAHNNSRLCTLTLLDLRTATLSAFQRVVLESLM